MNLSEWKSKKKAEQRREVQRCFLMSHWLAKKEIINEWKAIGKEIDPVKLNKACGPYQLKHFDRLDQEARKILKLPERISYSPPPPTKAPSTTKSIWGGVGAIMFLIAMPIATVGATIALLHLFGRYLAVGYGVLSIVLFCLAIVAGVSDERTIGRKIAGFIACLPPLIGMVLFLLVALGRL